MPIGIQTRPWGPEMNRNNLGQILSQAAAAGYDGFEIGAQHLDLDKPQWLSDLAAAHDLAIVGIHVGGEIHDPAAVQVMLAGLEHIMAYAAAVGAPFLPFSGRPKPDKTRAELEQQAAALNRIGHLCHTHGLQLCYHNHDWETIDDCRELRLLCDLTDPGLVSLCLDVGWVERAGGSAAEVVRTFLDRIAYYHIKDQTPDLWMEVGQGTVDFAALFSAIPRREDLWLVVEQDETQRLPAESAQMSRDSLRKWLDHE